MPWSAVNIAITGEPPKEHSPYFSGRAGYVTTACDNHAPKWHIQSISQHAVHLIRETMNYPKVSQIQETFESLRRRLDELGIEVPVDDRILTAAEGSPLAAPDDDRSCDGPAIAGASHPMEGWDANADGPPRFIRCVVGGILVYRGPS